jgi:UDP-4-amino-4,6-dideoxy-N-acetyl-beta-L-altrosamine transaminase
MISDTNRFLPYGRQNIDDDDIAEVVKVLKSDWLTSGPVTQQFEESLSKRLKVRHAISCSSGTAALHMAVSVSGLSKDDVAIVPAITFLATANAPRYLGAEVVFADVLPDTGLIDANHVEELIQNLPDKIKLIMPVHLNGQCADMLAIKPLAEKYNLKVISDSSHALGSRILGSEKISQAGNCDYEDMSTFSFHPVKTIAMGEGGAVTTNNDELAEKLLLIRNHGMTRKQSEFKYPEQALDLNGQPNPWYYEMHEPGFNYRASDIHCALGLSQLSKLDSFIQRRREIVELYNKLIEPLSPNIKPIRDVSNGEAARHLYVVLIEFESLGISRSDVMNKLKEKNIGSQVHYLPLYRQPYYQERYGKQRLSGAEEYYEKILSLPLYSTMQDDDVYRVVESLADILKIEQ